MTSRESIRGARSTCVRGARNEGASTWAQAIADLEALRETQLFELANPTLEDSFVHAAPLREHTRRSARVLVNQSQARQGPVGLAPAFETLERSADRRHRLVVEIVVVRERLA